MIRLPADDPTERNRAQVSPMPRRHESSEGLTRARRQFGKLLDAHLKRGQRADGLSQEHLQPWTNFNFAGVVNVSPNSVANWRHETLPEDVLPILDALFGNRPEFAGHRRDLKEAWAQAKGLVPMDGEEEYDGDECGEWLIIDSYLTPGIAELRLHPPRSGNASGTYYLDATLVIDTGEYDHEGDTLLIGLREAFLSVQSSSYQVAKNSIIGDRSDHANFKLTVGGTRVVGPLDDRGCLHGNPLGDEYMAVIEPVGERDEPVEVALRAGRRGFDITRADVSGDAPRDPAADINKDAILNVLISKGREKDPQGRVLLACARMKRRPR